MTVHPDILDFQHRHQLCALNVETFELRPKQRPLLEQVLTTTGDALIVGPTASGKTIAFIVAALQAIAHGQRVVFATVTRQLVDQFTSPQTYFRKFTTLPAQRIVGVTGSLSIAKRAALYQEKPLVIVGTGETLLEDIKRGTFVWDEIGLFGYDEIHHHQGGSTYTVLVPASRRPGIRRLYLTATPADDEPRLIGLLYDLQAKHRFILPEKERLPEEPVLVDLDDELTWAAAVLREVGSWCQQHIEHALPFRPGSLFEETEEEASRELPTFAERGVLRKKIDAIGESDTQRRWLISKWAELGTVCWLREVLVTCGRFGFLEAFAYHYAHHRIAPLGVTVPDVERRRDKGSKKLFEQRLVTNDRLWAVFARIASGTPYEAFVNEQSWQKILGMSETPALGPFLSEQVRQFFDSARDALARSRRVDHPKAQELLAILHRHPQLLPGSHVIVFTHTRRYAGFLASVLNERLQVVGTRAVAAVGGRTTRQARASTAALEDFRQGRAHILCSTDYVREGMDVPTAHVCVEYCTPDTIPHKKVQGRGRVGRTELSGHAYLYHLLTRQSMEPRRYVSLRRRITSAQQALQGRGLRLFPDDL